MANSYNNLAWLTRLLADDYPEMETYRKKAIACWEKKGIKNNISTCGFC